MHIPVENGIDSHVFDRRIVTTFHRAACCIPDSTSSSLHLCAKNSTAGSGVALCLLGVDRDIGPEQGSGIMYSVEQRLVSIQTNTRHMGFKAVCSPPTSPSYCLTLSHATL